MPELPEVETIRRDLAASARGKRIVSVEVLNKKTVKDQGTRGFSFKLTGARMTVFRRRGKNLIIGLDSGLWMVVHLKMTGVLQIQSNDDSLPRATRIIFNFEDGSRLVFSDQRKFGSVRLTDDPDNLICLSKLGPEPLSRSFTPKAMGQRLGRRSAPIKPLLLDQSVVAGLGNIYACEALHRAGIDPRRPASSLKGDEVARLHRSIQAVLKDAIKARGSSVDTYRDGRGRSGWFQVRHRVYDRQGHRCKRCGGEIVRQTLRGRGTYWCQRCQR